MVKLKTDIERIEKLRERLQKTCKKLMIKTVADFLGYNRAYISLIINNKSDGSSHFREIVEYKLNGNYEEILLYQNILDLAKKYIALYGKDILLYDLPERIKEM